MSLVKLDIHLVTLKTLKRIIIKDRFITIDFCIEEFYLYVFSNPNTQYVKNFLIISRFTNIKYFKDILNI